LCEITIHINSFENLQGAGLILATATEEPVEVRSLECNQQQGASRKKRNVEDLLKKGKTGPNKINSRAFSRIKTAKANLFAKSTTAAEKASMPFEKKLHVSLKKQVLLLMPLLHKSRKIQGCFPTSPEKVVYSATYCVLIHVCVEIVTLADIIKNASSESMFIAFYPL